MKKTCNTCKYFYIKGGYTGVCEADDYNEFMTIQEACDIYVPIKYCDGSPVIGGYSPSVDSVKFNKPIMKGLLAGMDLDKIKEIIICHFKR